MNDTLKQSVASAVQAAGYEFVGLEQVNAGRQAILRIYIDGAQGIGVDDCAKASRQVSAVLDVEDAIKTAYQLEVSSPGINRKLFELAQYTPFIGQRIKLKTQIAIDQQKQFKGVLTQVTNTDITLDSDTGTVTIPFNHIAKANVIAESSEASPNE